MYKCSYSKTFAELKLFDPDIDAKLAALDDEYEHCKHLRVGVAFNKGEKTGRFILRGIFNNRLFSEAWTYLYYGALIFVESSHAKIGGIDADIIPDNKDDLELDMLKMFYNLRGASYYLFRTADLKSCGGNYPIGEKFYSEWIGEIFYRVK